MDLEVAYFSNERTIKSDGNHQNHSGILTGWWFQAPWKIWKSVGMIIPNMWKKKCSKPPTSIQKSTDFYSPSIWRFPKSWGVMGVPPELSSSYGWPWISIVLQPLLKRLGIPRNLESSGFQHFFKKKFDGYETYRNMKIQQWVE